MAAWLGIGVLVLFSLGLNWFMRAPRSEGPVVPTSLGQWVRCAGLEPTLPGTFWESRMLLQPGAFLRRPYIIEQRRLRREVDGEILEVRPERRVS